MRVTVITDGFGYDCAALKTLETTGLRIDILTDDYRSSLPAEFLDTKEVPIDIAILCLPVSVSSPIDATITGYVLGAAKKAVRIGRVEPPRFFPPVPALPADTEPVQWLLNEYERYKKTVTGRFHKRTILDAGYGLSEFGLVRAIHCGNDVLVASFLALGFSPDLLNEDHIPILHLAIRARQVETTEVIIAAGADPNIRSSDRGNTAVAEAAAMKSPRIMKKLMEAGGDPNTATLDGQTPLMIAVGDGDKEVVEILLDAGASLDATDKLGMSPMKYARLFNKTKIIEMFEARLHC